MTAEWVAAATSAATLLVIAITAFAAIRQMGHTRAGNQVALFTAYNTEWDSPEFSRAFAFVRSLSTDKIDDETLELLAGGIFPGEYHQIRLVANFFEDLGAFVQAGLLQSTIVCMLYSNNLVDAWNALSPVVTFLRERRKLPAIWEHFEYLVSLAQDFIARYPHGMFPRDARRLPADDSLTKRYSGMRGAQ